MPATGNLSVNSASHDFPMDYINLKALFVCESTALEAQ